MFTEETKRNIIGARAKLYLKHPLFGHLGLYLNPTPRDSIATACVTINGDLYINPEMAEKMSKEGLMFVIAHEVMHIALASHNRKPTGADQEIWNMATDIQINYLLCNQENGAGMSLPDLPIPEKYRSKDSKDTCKPLYEGFEDLWGLTAEQTYRRLIEDPKRAKKAAENSWFDECSDFGDGTASEMEVWRQRIAAAQDCASQRQAGNSPGFLQDFFTGALSPRKNWRRILRLTVSGTLRKKYTWKLPNRRTISRGIKTPAKIKSRPIAVISFDTSGSMSDEDIRDAAAEGYGIARQHNADVYLVLHDCEAYFFGKIKPEAFQKLRVQRGGTNFNPVFERIKKEKIKPQVFIGFSDLEGPFPSESPDYEVIWCRPVGRKSKAPFGKHIDIERSNDRS